MNDKEAMRERFARYDAGLTQMVQAMREIREAAPAYWKARGNTVLPRLERLREDVMKEG